MVSITNANLVKPDYTKVTYCSAFKLKGIHAFL